MAQLKSGSTVGGTAILLDAANSVDTTNIAANAVTDAKISGMSSSKLTGALPALDGSSLTGIVTKATTAPSSPSLGDLWFDTNTSEKILKYYNGTDWLKVSAAVARLTSISGDVFAGAVSTLTLTGEGFLSSSLVVNFTQASDSIDVDVTVTPTSDTAATVTVPSSVYSNVTSGNNVSIKVTNSDGSTSAVVTKAATAPPSGGTISNSGGYRYHSFTGSGTFNTQGQTLTADVLLVGGGGASSIQHSGGAGAGGLIYHPGRTISSGSYSISIGGGGIVTSNANDDNNHQSLGASGGNTTGFGLTALGGGGASPWASSNNKPGGSGGSGGTPWNDGTRGQGLQPSQSGDSGTYGYGNQSGAASCGGGGAGTAGRDSANDTAAGDGKYIAAFNQWGTNSSNTTSGTRGYYGGGGGAGGGNGYSGGEGGGGGDVPNGQNYPPSYGNGLANTGGGGGGCGDNTTGGSGGSGIVVIRYQL